MLSDVAAYMAQNFGVLPSFNDAILRRFALTDNGKGTMTKAKIEAPCKVQIDELAQDQLNEGFAEDSVRLLILIDGLDKYLEEGLRVQDNDEIEIPSKSTVYRISGPKVDPLNTHVTCRGRLKPNA